MSKTYSEVLPNTEEREPRKVLTWRHNPGGDNLELLLRLGTDEDVPLIANSWLKSYRHSFECAGVPNHLFYKHHHKLLQDLIPRSAVVVLCNPEHPDHILGYIVYEKMSGCMVIHYCYIKQVFRRRGLARKMVEAILELEFVHPKDNNWGTTVIHTHRTKSMSDIYHSSDHDINELRHWTFNPYIKYDAMPEGWTSCE